MKRPDVSEREREYYTLTEEVLWRGSHYNEG